MSTSERFPNHQEPTCASPLDKEIAQTPPVRQGELDDGGGLVGGSPSSPSLEELLRLSQLSPAELLRYRLYLVWKKNGASDEAIRTMGRLLAQKLEARGLAFAGKSPECILALGTAFFHQLPTILARPRDQWSFDLWACKREYWKIVRGSSGAAWELEAKTRDRQRRRAKAGIVKQPAIYVEDRAPSDPAYVVLASLEQQNLREFFQDFRATELAPKEQLALDNMLNDKPTANNAEGNARQRVIKKLRRVYLEAQKGTDDMNAAVANDLADLKLGQRMQGETLDEILRGVEALRARDLEVIDDEEGTGK
jgi:hypothetical protein